MVSIAAGAGAAGAAGAALGIGAGIGGAATNVALMPFNAANNLLGSAFFGYGMIIGERYAYQEDWPKIQARLEKGANINSIMHEYAGRFSAMVMSEAKAVYEITVREMSAYIKEAVGIASQGNEATVNPDGKKVLNNPFVSQALLAAAINAQNLKKPPPSTGPSDNQWMQLLQTLTQNVNTPGKIDVDAANQKLLLQLQAQQDIIDAQKAKFKVQQSQINPSATRTTVEIIDPRKKQKVGKSIVSTGIFRTSGEVKTKPAAAKRRAPRSIVTQHRKYMEEIRFLNNWLSKRFTGTAAHQQRLRYMQRKTVVIRLVQGLTNKYQL